MYLECVCEFATRNFRDAAKPAGFIDLPLFCGFLLYGSFEQQVDGNRQVTCM